MNAAEDGLEAGPPGVSPGTVQLSDLGWRYFEVNRRSDIRDHPLFFFDGARRG